MSQPRVPDELCVAIEPLLPRGTPKLKGGARRSRIVPSWAGSLSSCAPALPWDPSRRLFPAAFPPDCRWLDGRGTNPADADLRWLLAPAL